MTICSFQPPLRTLMGPGPSDVSERVLQAMARPTVGHLDPSFIGMMDETKQLLQYVFQTKNELTFAVSAPGSAGMECCFANLVEPGDKVIVYGQSFEKGGWDYETIETNEPFDITKLKLAVGHWDGLKIINNIVYDGELYGSSGGDTSGKSMAFWIDD